MTLPSSGIPRAPHRLRLAAAAVLIATARALKAGARTRSDWYRLAAHGGSAWAGRLSLPAAVLAAEKAQRSVPAYTALCAGAATSGASVPSGRTAPSDWAAWLAALPVTDKASYVEPYPMAARCRGGAIPASQAELDESSGSSGRPFTWIRSRAELADLHRSSLALARHLVDRPSRAGRPLVVLNGFSMGAWATGTNVTAALRDLGVIESIGPDTGRMLTTMALLGPGRVYVITGYPPFLGRLLDEADRSGFDLAMFTLWGVVGGEAMSEAVRTRLERRFEFVLSAYGASDLDIGVAAETPLSVEVRRAAAADPALARALFGTAGRLPMVFQYDPSDYFVETIDGELVVTVLRPSMLSPRIRYNVHDAGGTLGYHHAVRTCAAAGYDVVGAARARQPRSPFPLPFLFVHGRSDSTVSFQGANIYPEDVEQALAESPDAERLGAFALAVEDLAVEDLPDAAGDCGPRVCVYVEVADPADVHDRALAARLSQGVRRRLEANSADYRAAVAEDPAAGDLGIRLHPVGAGPFAENASRIKRRYILSSTPKEPQPC
jgi:phenylacetate-CoA ligase